MVVFALIFPDKRLGILGANPYHIQHAPIKCRTAITDSSL
jgi:hypothetical protein